VTVLYRSLGYRVKLEISGFSPGVTKYTMETERVVYFRKPLA
jgi:hypothetical protein